MEIACACLGVILQLNGTGWLETDTTNQSRFGVDEETHRNLHG